MVEELSKIKRGRSILWQLYRLVTVENRKTRKLTSLQHNPSNLSMLDFVLIY